MKKVFLVFILNLAIFIMGLNFALAQDPNDPGFPDTVWISQVLMSETVDPLGWPRQFAVKCSIFTDEELAGIAIPISFYHSQNLDILVDTMFWSEWVDDAKPDVEGLQAQNDSVASPDFIAKGFLGSAVWFRDSLPPSRDLLFTVYFNEDFFSVINWDTTRGIVLDTLTFYPGGMPLHFVTPSAEIFVPIFKYGAIGGVVTITGRAYKPDGVTPDSGAKVFFKGKDILRISGEDTLFSEGRKGVVKTDASGNYQILVGKDAYWCVFRDTSTQMIIDTNAYCFDSLTTDTSYIDFYGEYLPGQGTVISGICYKTPPTPDENKKVYLDGDLNDFTTTNNSGYYEFNVKKGGNYCVRVKSDAEACDSTYAYIFNSLMDDTFYNDFKGDKLGGWVFISGTTWRTPPEPLPEQKVYLTGLVRSGVSVAESTISDTLGNYKFRMVERGSKYYVFMDTTGGLDTTYNAYFFKRPKVDVSYIDFVDSIPGGRAKISGFVYHYREMPWEGASVYLYGYDLNNVVFRKDTTFTNSLGNYEFFNVLMGLKYCVFIDITGGMDSTNSYCFDSLVTDTANNNFMAPSVDVEEESKEAVPEHFALFQNYPNPFNPYTLIRFALPEDCEVKLEIYNILGQKVKTLVDGFFTKGIQEVVWDGKNQKEKEVASGIYFYRIKTKKYTEIKKMVLLR